MATRAVVSRVDRFAGLSDRALPLNVTRIECPDLLNVEFTDGSLSRRGGFTRVTSQLQDCSALFDGFNDYGRLKGYTADTRLGVAIEVALESFPNSANTEVTLLSRGYGTGAARYFQLSYDTAINSGLGGWRVRAWDATGGGALRNVTINDGDGTFGVLGAGRHIEVYVSDAGTNTFTFAVKTSAGTSIGSTTFVLETPVVTVAGSIDDWFVGCDSSNGADADLPNSFFAGRMSTLRLGNTATAANITAVQVYGRELWENPDAAEQASLGAYFKLNDGVRTPAQSSVSDHEIVWGNEGPSWVDDETLVYGNSGLRFYGETGHIVWDVSNVYTTLFNSAATGYRKWAVSLVFVPLLAEGESTVRNQTILWCGVDAGGVPRPLGIRVVSDLIEVTYRDGTSTKTVVWSGSLPLSTVTGQRIRIVVSYDDLATDRVQGYILTETATAPIVGTVNTDGADPSSISSTWTIGRRLTSATYPFTFATSSAYGIIDDVAVVKDYSVGAGNGPRLPFGAGRKEIDASSFVSGATGVASANIQTMCGLRLNDGVGNNLLTFGAQTTTAYLLPESNDGISWGPGLVTPYDPPKFDLLYDYRRLSPTGATIRKILAVYGGVFYEIDRSTGAATAISGILKGDGPCTVTQYSNVVFIGRPNGDRPYRYDGKIAYKAGIRAPVIPPTTATAAGASSFSTATYNVYYTFRNSKTGVESNPSPTATVSLTNALQIDSILLQRSGDPQVDQRRIYITAASGGAGSNAYLQVTVENNIDTSYTTNITAHTTTGSLLEYTSNEEPPNGAIVTVFADRLFVAGVPNYPTRVFYSEAGSLESFNQTTNYEDADLDAGDPVVALMELRGLLVAYFKDGRVPISATLDPDFPFFLDRTSREVGAAGPGCVIPTEQGHFIFSGDNLFLWNGQNSESLSSPSNPAMPSVQYTMRKLLTPSRLKFSVMAQNSLKDQIWLTVTESSTRGRSAGLWQDAVLVYDTAQGVWTRFQLDADYIAEIEDADDRPSMYFGSYGFLCKMSDDVGYDGVLQPGFTTTSYVPNTINTNSISLVNAASFVAGSLVGLWMYYTTTGGVVSRARIRRHTSSVLYFDVDVSGCAASRNLSVAGIPFYADFVADWGNPMTLKRLGWFKSAAFHRYAASGTAGSIGLFFSYDSPRRTYERSSAHSLENIATIGSTNSQTTLDLLVGSQTCRSVYLHLTGLPFSSYSGTTITDATVGLPSDILCPSIIEFQLEAKEVSAR